MANIVVNIELRDGQPTSPSRFALGEARRVARALGATVYALVVGNDVNPLGDTLVTPLGRAGADKVLLVADPRAAACPIEPLWRDLLDAVVERLRPRLVLWPAGSVGLQLGPLLAVRLGAAFFPRASLLLEPGGIEGEPRLLLRRWTEDLGGHWTIGVGAAFAPAVATLPAGRPVVDENAGPAELAVLRAGDDGPRGIDIVATGPSPHGPADLASTVVVIDDGHGDETLPLLPHVRPDVTIVGDDGAAEVLQEATPQLVVLLSARGAGAALERLRLSPDGHVVVLAGGRRGPPRSPLVDHIWKVERPTAITTLAAALLKAGE